MSQQDFWKWAEDQSAEKASQQVVAGKARGKLFLSELPTDLGLSLPEIQTLHRQLQERLGAVDLVLTDNRRRMISGKRRRDHFKVRLHHMFVGAEAPILDALETLLSSRGPVEEARQKLQAYVNEHREEISYDVDPSELEVAGEHHDLEAMLEKWRQIFESEILEDVKITWGRKGKGSRTIRFGSYDFDRKLIRMHPALDQPWVPPFFVEFIVYHELLHALFPPRKRGSRREVHTEEFRKMEEKFPRYKEAMLWEQRNLSRFLEQ